ncbi:MAG: hypothetical protein WBC74_00795 [Candidatus Omnitrophota bacterium]
MTGTSGYYTYLISSLPMLHFGRSKPFSFEKFLDMCAQSVSANDVEIIKSCAGIERSPYDDSQSALKKWHAFDTALRNALVKIRSARKHKDPDKYLRPDEYQNPHATNLAMNAYKNPSVLESEKILDEARWRALDELTVGHHFDIDFLILYAHKLLILEKWDKVNAADKSRILEETLQKG